MNNLKLLSLLLVVVLLNGCASGAEFGNMTYTNSTELKYDDALKKDIGLKQVEGGEETNPLWTSEISNEAFKKSS